MVASKKIRKRTAWIMILMFLFTLIPPGEYNWFTSHAAPISVGNGVGVTKVTYVQNQTGTSISGAMLQIFGSSLKDASVFLFINGEAKQLKNPSTNTSGLLKYDLTATDVSGFTGEIRIEDTNLIIRSQAYPLITSIPSPVVNLDNPTMLTLNLKGTNLTTINTDPTHITATYINKNIVKNITLNPGATSSSVVFTPDTDSATGLQDISILDQRTTDAVSSDVAGIATETRINYYNAFQIVKSLSLTNLSMVPNAGSPGDTVEISSDGYPASAGYKVYFTGTNASNQPEELAATSVTLSADRKTLTAVVPNATKGTKTVTVVDTDTDTNEEITARVTVGTFNLIETTNKPRVTAVEEPSGPDSGSVVTVQGKNLIKPFFSDLTVPSNVTVSGAVVSADKKSLDLTYDTTGFLYSGSTVKSTTRTMKVTIGDLCTFQAFTSPSTTDGSDSFDVKTPVITDADVDPKKDVVVEMTTTIVATVSGVDKTYVYKQVARLTDGFTFIPSSLKPTVTKVTPNTIHLASDRSVSDNIMVSIEGTNFMVNKWSDGTTVHTNYPVVYVHTGVVPDTSFTLMFDKNGNPANNNGRIYYTDGSHILTDGTNEIPVDMVVLDANNNIMDGTEGKDVGTRIVLYIPKQAKINGALIQNLIVQNPNRNSDDLGLSGYKKDALTFVVDPSTPVVESLVPSVVTVGGGSEVVITGSSSIEEGAKVFIDGKEVTGVTRSLDLTGNKVLLKFKAPAGRLGKTQLAVMNPGGGIAVRDFYYVQSYNKDPILTTVAPDKGTEGTLLVLGGDNYFKPDPSAASTAGMDAYKLIGTRVLMDGVDVSSYNTGSYGEIVFKAFTSLSSNQILQIATDALGAKKAVTSDYAHSVILEGPTGHYYTLTTLFDGTVRLSDGKTNKYTITLDSAGTNIIAYSDSASSTALPIVVSDTGFTINGTTTLSMITPYTFSSNVITGNRTRVISKNQIAVTVPWMQVAGLKSVTVKNPDTVEVTKKDCFTYYDSPFPSPTVTNIDPNFGSVSGGYLINIYGTNFDSTTQVFLDGAVIPSSDTTINAAGTQITIKVPKYSRNLSDYETDRITVPVVVVNSKAGTASIPKGFTYISPSKEPTLTKVTLDKGGASGGDIVELDGTNFNYYEPFKNLDGVPGYQTGGKDTFTDVNGNGTWDDLSGLSDSGNPLLEETSLGATYLFYDKYYKSAVLPKVFFGTTQAKVVRYGPGKLVVVTPPGSGAVDVYVVNNDSGISNKLKYTYSSSSPKITYINPAQGARVGQENRDIYGTGFVTRTVSGYTADNDTAPVASMPGIEALVRFADISNRSVVLGQANDGKIGGGEQAMVSLEGNLVVAYNGSNNTVKVSLTENGTSYTRTFSGYTDGLTMIPVGMLKTSGGKYYVPNGFSNDGTAYNTATHYELIKVEVDSTAGRFYVERGYAPRTDFDTSTHINLDTPSYYTIGDVNVTFFNQDGGTAIGKYTYRNPASKPIIRMVKPQTLMDTGTEYMVEASVKGGITIEIKGYDFRTGVKVYIDNKEMEVVDITTDTTTVPGETLDVIIARVPAGTTSQIGIKYPLLVVNTDGAIASSVDVKTLSTADKKPIYFIYRNPLSDPVITAVTPSETSVYGGNEIVVTGTDFRAGAMVIIGSKGGIPVTPTSIDTKGTYIKFTTPTSGLTIGSKDLQVVNADFGTGIKTNGLKIVSYPKITAFKSSDGKSELESVSTDGGTIIRINGSGFATGAKVIFGGTRALKTSSSTGESGLWKDDKYYSVADGTAATTVEFVDSTALLVTVPKMAKGTAYTVTIINADSGISDGDQTLQFSLPVPTAPVNLSANVIEDRYIRIYGYSSSNFDYYEVYAYIGTAEDYRLISDGYSAFQMIGNTTSEPFRITKLNGIETMTETQKLKLVIRAVNKYGPSGWSNIVSLTKKNMEDLKLGQEDFDGELDVPLGDSHSVNKQEQMAVVTMSTKTVPSSITIDLARGEYSNMKQFLVNVPEQTVLTKATYVKLGTPKAVLQFSSMNLNTSDFYTFSSTDKMQTYFNVRLDELNTQSSGQALNRAPRSVKVLSPVFALTTLAKNNTDTKLMGSTNGYMSMTLNYNTTQAQGLNLATCQIYWYNSASGQWEPIASTVNASSATVSAKVSKPGQYAVFGKR